MKDKNLETLIKNLAQEVERMIQETKIQNRNNLIDDLLLDENLNEKENETASESLRKEIKKSILSFYKK